MEDRRKQSMRMRKSEWFDRPMRKLSQCFIIKRKERRKKSLFCLFCNSRIVFPRLFSDLLLKERRLCFNCEVIFNGSHFNTVQVLLSINVAAVLLSINVSVVLGHINHWTYSSTLTIPRFEVK